MRTSTGQLPVETDACASVTAAFLQVLHTLHTAETCRIGEHRNILQILSNNTRRTKVVELSTGTHRVPDELRKHYLSDGEGGQYSTNLDRNRYGNDDQYLFTVIRYDLEFLSLCPCMVDVEIIDAKNDSQSVFVSAGPDACICNGAAGAFTAHPVVAAPAPVAYPARSRGDGGGGGSGSVAGVGGSVIGGGGGGFHRSASRGGGGGGGMDSPRRSNSGNVSQLFDALVMAATGGTEGAAAPGAGGEPPVDSRFGGRGGGWGSGAGGGAGNGGLPLGSADARAPATPPGPRGGAAAGQGGTPPGGSAAGVERGSGTPPGAGPAIALGAAPGVSGGGGAVARQHGMPARQRSRLWSALSLGDVDSLQNALDAFRAEEEIVSGPAGPPSAFAEAAGAPMPSNSGGFGPPGPGESYRRRQRKPVRAPSSSMLAGLDSGVLSGLLKGSGLSGLREKSGDNVGGGGGDVVSSGAAGGGRNGGGGGGDDDGGGSQEDDSGAGGGRGGGNGGTPRGGGRGGAGAGTPRAARGDGDEEGGAEVDGEAGGGAGASGALGMPRRVRHVPRQSSAVNLATCVGPAEVKRLAAECGGLRAENKRLEGQLREALRTAAAAASGGGDARAARLEGEVAALRQEVAALAAAKAVSEERVAALTHELATTRATANQVLQRLLTMQNGNGMSTMLAHLGGGAAAGVAAAAPPALFTSGAAAAGAAAGAPPALFTGASGAAANGVAGPPALFTGAGGAAANGAMAALMGGDDAKVSGAGGGCGGRGGLMDVAAAAMDGSTLMPGVGMPQAAFAPMLQQQRQQRQLLQPQQAPPPGRQAAFAAAPVFNGSPTLPPAPAAPAAASGGDGGARSTQLAALAAAAAAAVAAPAPAPAPSAALAGAPAGSQEYGALQGGAGGGLSDAAAAAQGGAALLKLERSSEVGLTAP